MSPNTTTGTVMRGSCACVDATHGNEAGRGEVRDALVLMLEARDAGTRRSVHAQDFQQDQSAILTAICTTYAEVDRLSDAFADRIASFGDG